MISQLEQEIEKVDERIGGKLHLIDKDDDGLISAEELEAAITQQLRSKANLSPEAVHKLVEELMLQADADGDGVLTTAELSQWVAAKVEAKEVEVHVDRER